MGDGWFLTIGGAAGAATALVLLFAGSLSIVRTERAHGFVRACLAHRQPLGALAFLAFYCAHLVPSCLHTVAQFLLWLGCGIADSALALQRVAGNLGSGISGVLAPRLRRWAQPAKAPASRGSSPPTPASAADSPATPRSGSRRNAGWLARRFRAGRTDGE
jgi:hypothetical protein